MTEETMSSIKEELRQCRREMVSIGDKLRKLNLARLQLLEAYFGWKDRFDELNMQLALETKLTVVGRGRKSATVDQLEAIMQDPKKAKQLLTLLKEDGNGRFEEAEPLTPNVPLTN